MLTETAFHSAESPLAFACGPTALIESVATYLLELGYEPERVRTERFGPTGN
jgi:ferredoxin-NADP reductase